MMSFEFGGCGCGRGCGCGGLVMVIAASSRLLQQTLAPAADVGGAAAVEPAKAIMVLPAPSA